MSSFIEVGFFLVSVIFGLLSTMLWLRIALRYLKVSSLDPFNTMIQKVTNPLVQPFNVLFRKHYKPGERIDWTAFLVLVFIEIFKICILSLILFYRVMPYPFLILYVVCDLILVPCNLLFYAILIRVILSYTNPQNQYAFSHFLYLLTEPFFVLGRNIVPNISGFDFSPFVIMIILEVMTLFIKASLPWKII